VGDWICVGKCNWYDARGDKIRAASEHGDIVLEFSNGCPSAACGEEDSHQKLSDEARFWTPTVYDRASGTINFIGKYSWAVQAAVSHDGKAIIMRCYDSTKNNGTAWVKVQHLDPGKKEFSTYTGGTSCQ
jgi:hypothetical protein